MEQGVWKIVNCLHQKKQRIRTRVSLVCRPSAGDPARSYRMYIHEEQFLGGVKRGAGASASRGCN